MELRTSLIEALNRRQLAVHMWTRHICFNLTHCRQIHAEAEPELYSLHEFAFREKTSGIEPFLSSLSPTARNHIWSLSFTLATQHYPPQNNLQFVEWQLAHVDMEQALTYTAENLRLKKLDLCLRIELAEECCEGSWARSLVQIQGLDYLRCPVGSPRRWKLFPQGITVEEDDPTR